jgi:acyl-CoA synthetase (AMP-forming)/AMP-acid ligase II
MATVSHVLAERADRESAATAFVFPDEHVEVTFGDIGARARAFSHVLEARGVVAGDRFAIMMGNGLAYVTCLLGAWRFGAAVVPVDPMLKGPDARDLIMASGSSALAIDQKRLVELHGLRRECTTLRATIVAGAHSPQDGDIELDAVLAAAASSNHQQLLNVASDAVAVESYRAHTDGFEPVRRTHADLLADANALTTELRLNDSDRAVCAIQLGHRDGMTALVTALTSGGQCVVPERFDGRRFWELVAAQRATWLALVPTQFYDLYFGGPPASAAHKAVRSIAVAGSSIPAQARDDFEQKFGIPVRAMRPV